LRSVHADAGEVAAQRPGEADFSEADALRRLTGVAQPRVTEFLATARRAGEVESPAITIDGRLISLEDLRLVEFRFEPRATLITTSVNSINTSTGFPKPTDAWVAVWLREGVPAPEWGGILTTVRVVAIIEDGTGKVRSVHAGKFNPSPAEGAIPAPPPAVARCTADPSGFTGNRVCVR
jgi:hypothetical protein